MYQMHADKREEITEVIAGDIAAFVGLKDTGTGDTLTAMNLQGSKANEVSSSAWPSRSRSSTSASSRRPRTASRR